MGKMGNKRKANDEEYDATPSSKQKLAPHIKNQEKRLIVILESAQLESVKVRLPCISWKYASDLCSFLAAYF